MLWTYHLEKGDKNHDWHIPILERKQGATQLQPRWRCRYIHVASWHNQKKDNNKFTNKKQPELPENLMVWRSDNQGVKEETFIQTGRKARDGQPVWEDALQGGRRGWARWCLAEWEVPHCMDKEGGITGERDRLCHPGFQPGKLKHQKLLALQTCGDCGRRNT